MGHQQVSHLCNGIDHICTHLLIYCDSNIPAMICQNHSVRCCQQDSSERETKKIENMLCGCSFQIELLQMCCIVSYSFSLLLRAFNRENNSITFSHLICRITTSLETLVANTPITRPDEPVVIASEAISILALCPSDTNSAYTASVPTASSVAGDAGAPTITRGSGAASNGKRSLLFNSFVLASLYGL